MLLEQLQNTTAVALDTAIFIYAFEQHPRFGALAQSVFRAIESGRFQGFASVLTLGEVLTGVKRADNPDLLFRYRDVFQRFPGLRLCTRDVAVMEQMSNLRIRYNLRTPDAIHIGTALVYGVETFITNDLHLKCVTDLDVVVLADFV